MSLDRGSRRFIVELACPRDGACGGSTRRVRLSGRRIRRPARIERTRIAPLGLVAHVERKLHRAFRSHTIWAAHQMFLDDRIGSIEVGKDADLAVSDRNPCAVPTDALKDLRCDLTLLAGNIVSARP